MSLPVHFKSILLTLINLHIWATVAYAVPCPKSWKNLPTHQQNKPIHCDCIGSSSGAVWGSQIYTTDSNICRAATHAGVISVSGGSVMVAPVQGCRFYDGTQAHGVSTSSWGGYENSFYFPAVSQGVCPIRKEGDLCPPNFKSIPKSQQAAFRCMCSPKVSSGNVWGTSTYTSDSSICNAAQHAGVISAHRGEVLVKATKGCQKYIGTRQNGVTTQSWGSYPLSFYFDGDGSCPTQTQQTQQTQHRGLRCPRFNEISKDEAMRGFKCLCPAGSSFGSVYGSSPFTTDSDICELW